MAAELIDVDDEHLVGSYSALLVAIWGARTRPEKVEKLIVQASAFVDRWPRMAMIVIVEPDSELPGKEARKKLEELAALLMPKTTALAYVFEGTGLRAIATRTLMTLENLRPVARQGQLDVAFQSAERRIMATTQPGAIAQLLTNFLTNSATHGRNPDESRRLSVKVSLALVERKIGQRAGSTPTLSPSESVVLAYEDDGRGMPEEIRQRAFQPFFTTARGKGGSGLGLYIVQSLVSDVLRGTVRLETAPGAGVRLEIELPIDGRGPAPAAAP